MTGGGRGIGACTARLAGARDYAVCVNYLRDRDAAAGVVDDIVSQGGRAIAVQADISVEAEVAALFETVDERLGRPTALVNNAARLEAQMRLETMDAARMHRMFATNVVGTMLCAREAVRRMSTRQGGEGGSIVNVSSGAARYGSPGEYVDYAATKGAVDTFTIGLAREVAEDGIRVNAVRPGFIYTGMHASGGEPGRVDRVKSLVPMQRGGQPEEVAAAILWLLSRGSLLCDWHVYRCLRRPVVERYTNSWMYIRVNERDNVAIIVEPEGFVTARERIPQSHKVSLVDIEAGGPITRYGQTIGIANRAIAAGSWVREELMDMPAAPGLDELPLATAVPANLPALEGYTFQGYRNPDGSAGTKNLLGIATTVQCVAPTVDYAVRRIQTELLPLFPNVDGAVAVSFALLRVRRGDRRAGGGGADSDAAAYRDARQYRRAADGRQPGLREAAAGPAVRQRPADPGRGQCNPVTGRAWVRRQRRGDSGGS